MIRYYSSQQKGKKLTELTAAEKDCWIYMENPSLKEITAIATMTGVQEDHFKTVLDEDEVAHLDIDDDAKVIVVDIPESEHGFVQTRPLALIITDDYLISVCTAPNTVLQDFLDGKIKNMYTTKQKSKLVYQITLHNSKRFLYYLKQIDKRSDLIQKDLAKSMKNKEVLQLLEIQKSLVFLSSSINANFSVIQKLYIHASKAPEEDRDILEDVILETKQAIEMSSVYREIIKSTMDAFGSVVNNNQNTIMKILTALTILLTIPMIIASYWGMNTGVPWGGILWGFWVVVGISVVITIISAVIMWKKRMF